MAFTENLKQNEKKRILFVRGGLAKIKLPDNFLQNKFLISTEFKNLFSIHKNYLKYLDKTDKNKLSKNQIKKMKKLMNLILFVAVISVFSACQTHSKANTWSADQQKEWKKSCTNLLMENGVDKAVAKDRCDCMFEKTSEKYTPDEAAKIDLKQEKELWDECDYSW